MFFIKSGKNRDQLSDQELISRYKASGDNAFVGTLFERYSQLIYGICLKYIDDRDQAKDAAMEVFEYLLSELKKYEIHNFKSWLARATRNFCLMRLRKNHSQEAKAEEFKKNEVLLMEQGDNFHPDTEDAQERTLRNLNQALDSLKEEQKWCVELFYLQDKSYQEVADITGYSLNQVKSYIQNGKRNLKIQLKSSNNE